MSQEQAIYFRGIEFEPLPVDLLSVRPLMHAAVNQYPVSFVVQIETGPCHSPRSTQKFYFHIFTPFKYLQLNNDSRHPKHMRKDGNVVNKFICRFHNVLSLIRQGIFFFMKKRMRYSNQIIELNRFIHNVPIFQLR